MKTGLVAAFVGVVLLVLTGGCTAPALSSRPLNEHEQLWAQFIRASYSAWELPYLTPVQPSGDQPPEHQAAESSILRFQSRASILPPPSSKDEAPSVTDEVKLVPVEKRSDR